MLFNDTTAAIAKAIFDGHISQVTQARKQDAAKRLDYYHDGQLEHLKTMLEQRFAQPEKLTPLFINVVKKVVDLRAMVYTEEPKRQIDGTDADKALFAEIVEDAALSTRMKQASRLVKLLKTAMVRPVWRNGRLDLDLLTGDILDVQVGDSPEDITAICVSHFPEAGRTEEMTYSVWTPTTWERLDYRGRHLDGGPNPYAPVLPFVALHDRAPTDSFWLPGGDDLIVAQEAINNMLVGLLQTVDAQGYGLGFVRGAGSGGGQLQAGPGSLIELPEGGEVGFAAPQAPIEEVTGAIDRIIKWLAVSNGLPAASLSTDPTEESGVSKIVGNRELEELRRDDVSLWRTYEKRLFQVIRQVWNHHNPTRKLSEAATLAVDFADPKPAVSSLDQAKEWELLIGLGLMSPVDAAMERNPDLSTREDALAFLLTVQQERAALTEKVI
ncbi:hypothetical protein NNJEOMEG_00044 [Fundidesulfovibrio magnetotacticus]|uniref:Phage portal protein n=2 Tax=Fundidesulfovibrio magnetotacticus TaxID=2730080 RepID=A0A6V8LHN4_9BACT|nr:hypothetical protein NNJEOMEG_00044 [Fundidesulfovibrio magnetotacticus]